MKKLKLVIIFAITTLLIACANKNPYVEQYLAEIERRDQYRDSLIAAEEMEKLNDPIKYQAKQDSIEKDRKKRELEMEDYRKKRELEEYQEVKRKFWVGRKVGITSSRCPYVYRLKSGEQDKICSTYENHFVVTKIEGTQIYIRNFFEEQYYRGTVNPHYNEQLRVDASDLEIFEDI